MVDAEQVDSALEAAADVFCRRALVGSKKLASGLLATVVLNGGFRIIVLHQHHCHCLVLAVARGGGNT